jgi:hypothetical protein
MESALLDGDPVYSCLVAQRLPIPDADELFRRKTLCKFFRINERACIVVFFMAMGAPQAHAKLGN